MGILLGVVAKAVVKGGVGGFEFDVVDQFAAFGSGECRRGELPAAAFGQQQILHVSGIVGRQFQGTADGGQHFGAAVELGQVQQATQMDAGLDRTAVQAASGRRVPPVPRRRIPAPAPAAAAAGAASAPPGGVPAARAIGRVRNCGRVAPRPGLRAAGAVHHGWREW